MSYLNWHPDIAAKTQGILRAAEERKPSWIKVIDGTIYWVLLIITIFANLIISVSLVPLLLALNGFWLYALLFLIGLSFGGVFCFILHSIEKIQRKQKIISVIFIPAFALINIGMFTILSNNLIGLLHLSTPTHSPVFVSIIYVLGYILPEAISHAGKRKV